MNKKTIILLFLITAIVHFWQFAPSEERKILPMIYPGMGLAEIKLGDQANLINKSWSEKADEVTKIALENRTEFLLLYRDRGILFMCDEGAKVQRVVCKSPALLVKGSGLRVGSLRKDIERAYSLDRYDEIKLLIYDPKNSAPSPSPNSLIVYYPKGIAFTLKDDKVTAITVFPSQAEADKKIFSAIMSVGLSWNELLYIGNK